MKTQNYLPLYTSKFKLFTLACKYTCELHWSSSRSAFTLSRMHNSLIHRNGTLSTNLLLWNAVCCLLFISMFYVQTNNASNLESLWIPVEILFNCYHDIFFFPSFFDNINLQMQHWRKCFSRSFLCASDLYGRWAPEYITLEQSITHCMLRLGMDLPRDLDLHTYWEGSVLADEY